VTVPCRLEPCGDRAEDLVFDQAAAGDLEDVMHVDPVVAGQPALDPPTVGMVTGHHAGWSKHVYAGQEIPPVAAWGEGPVEAALERRQVRLSFRRSEQQKAAYRFPER
jgi:hypothetical protein